MFIKQTVPKKQTQIHRKGCQELGLPQHGRTRQAEKCCASLSFLRGMGKMPIGLFIFPSSKHLNECFYGDSYRKNKDWASERSGRERFRCARPFCWIPLPLGFGLLFDPRWPKTANIGPKSGPTLPPNGSRPPAEASRAAQDRQQSGQERPRPATGPTGLHLLFAP